MFALFYKDERPGQWKLYSIHPFYADDLIITMHEKFADQKWLEGNVIGFLFTSAPESQLFISAQALLEEGILVPDGEAWLVKGLQIPDEPPTT